MTQILRHAVTSNNCVERLWITYVGLNQLKQYKRVDMELNGATNCYGNRRYYLLGYLELVERDYDGTRTRIAKDVHLRVLLAHIIVIRNGVRPSGLSQNLYYVHSI